MGAWLLRPTPGPLARDPQHPARPCPGSQHLTSMGVLEVGGCRGPGQGCDPGTLKREGLTGLSTFRANLISLCSFCSFSSTEGSGPGERAVQGLSSAPWGRTGPQRGWLACARAAGGPQVCESRDPVQRQPPAPCTPHLSSSPPFSPAGTPQTASGSAPPSRACGESL